MAESAGAKTGVTVNAGAEAVAGVAPAVPVASGLTVGRPKTKFTNAKKSANKIAPRRKPVSRRMAVLRSFKRLMDFHR